MRRSQLQIGIQSKEVKKKYPRFIEGTAVIYWNISGKQFVT